MRNLKRALSLALASVMLLGMMVVGTSAFDDVTESHNEEAIAVMKLAGIMIGDDKGNFNPDKKVTRNEMAVVMANMLGLDVEDYAGIAPFTDVPAWAEAYVSACYANKIVSGTSATTYNGDANVTAVEAGLMVMKALDYFQYASDFGSDWKVATIKQASKIDLYEDVKAKTNDALTRNEVAQICFNALNTEMVSYVESNLAVNENGALYNVYNYYTTEGENILKDELFDGALYMDEETTTDDLGRPVVTWVYAEEGEEEVTATVTKSAELVYANTADADAVEKDLKAAKLAKDAEEETAAAIEEAAVPGTTVYVYEVEDEVVIVPVAKAYTTVETLGEDKVSTKDADERYITFANGLTVVADDEVEITGVEGVEVDNFETLYKLEEEDAVIVIVAGEENYIYSAEIPEVVEAKITRVKDTTVTAGGKTYYWAAADAAEITTEAVELTVLDGVVYNVAGIDEESEIIYVSKVFEPETDKWGKVTQTAQIVNEKFELVEVAVDTGDDNDTAISEETTGFFKYTTNNDGEYTFVSLTEGDMTDVSAVDSKDAIRAGDYYFADGVKYVYISDAGTADVAVTVKEGVQKNAAGTAVLNDDDDIILVYVMDAYDDGASDDVIFLANTDVNAVDSDKKGNAANEYKVYIDGEEKFWLIDETVAEGFWTYEQDEETGVYALVAEKGENDVEIEINKDKYVTYGDIEDATVAKIYDLTDEGLTTLKKIAAWDGDALTFSFLYDEDAEVITALYVDFAPAE